MAKFRYVGNPSADDRDHDSITAFGVDFEYDEVTEVPDTDTHAINKLRGNSHFREVTTKPAGTAEKTKTAATKK